MTIIPNYSYVQSSRCTMAYEKTEADYAKLIEPFVLRGVTPTGKELAKGAFGTVFEVKCCGIIYAAKEIHSLLVGFDGSVQQTKTYKHKFLRMCYLQSKCRHPNIVQFIGIYHSASEGMIPTMVMERMDCTLRTFIEQNTASLHNVLSLLYDVSLGVWYLHNCNPPVIHCDLTPTSILVNTTSMVAKIAGFDAASEGYEGDEAMSGGVHFMPPEAFERPAIYGLLLDVFAYGGTALYAVVGEWPELSQSIQIDPNTGKKKVFSEVERRLQHLNKMTGEAAVLRPLVEECLNNDPARRPTIEVVSERIKEIKIKYMEHHPEIKVIHY